jgi:hypothetical protein
MMKTNTHVWIWMQDHEVYKAVYVQMNRSLTVSNEKDEIILQYKGISYEQLARVVRLFMQLGAKKMDGRREPFTYL